MQIHEAFDRYCGGTWERAVFDVANVNIKVGEVESPAAAAGANHFVCLQQRRFYGLGETEKHPDTQKTGPILQGHVEFSICDTADMGSGDVADQECFNKYPLTRAAGDDYNSPIDPEYPGRYYPAPPCSAWETGQGVNEGYSYENGYDHEPYTVKVRYELPEITCTHCIMQMHYCECFLTFILLLVGNFS